MLKKVHFENRSGIKLSAIIELPVGTPKGYALFAHCFTCNKNLTPVRNISRALINRDIAVMRFDFTGLGESEGDFAETSFSSNIEDLLDACNFLALDYSSPEILIGHSLGGAAVFFAANKISSVKAIVTIGAPSDPSHVQHLFHGKLSEIQEKGDAVVNIGGRSFTVKNEFLKDIKSKNMKRALNDLSASLLVIHSPQDTIVGIENASEIYKAARHPKSFVSLDGADHLLSKKSDSQYVGDLASTWSARYLDTQIQDNGIDPLMPVNGVRAILGDKGYTTQLSNGRHSFVADEPESFGGQDLGPTPYDLLSASLASCTAMTMKMYANRKKWDLKAVEVSVEHFKDFAYDCEHCDDKNAKVDHLHKTIKITGELDKVQISRLLEIADKCPVNRTLNGEVHITNKLI